MLSLKTFFSPRKNVIQDTQEMSHPAPVDVLPQEEERKHLGALYQAAHDPGFVDVRRRISQVGIRAWVLQDIDFKNPEHFVQFSKLIAPFPIESHRQSAKSQASSTPVPQSPLEQSVGANDFTVIKKLGFGSSGSVYLGQHGTSRRYLAIKRMEKEFLDAENFTALLNEQRALRTVRGNEFLLSLEASFHDAENFFLVTAFHPGGDLRRQIEKYGVLPAPRALFYVAEILLALRALHGLGIVHRDIKPENIVVDAFGHVVLVDFGLAKQWEMSESSSATAASPHSQAPRLLTLGDCGTPAYTAPEIFQRKPYGLEVDLWSLGVTAFELICGRTPFKNTTDFDEVRHSILYDEVSFEPSDIVHPLVQIFLHHALQKDPSQRLSLEGMMSHACFRYMDWELLAAKQIEAPWAPGQFDLFEEIRDAKASGECFQLVSGDSLAHDPFPAYNFVAPDFNARVPRPFVPACALVVPAVSIDNAATSGKVIPASPALSTSSSGSSIASPALSSLFGKVRRIFTPHSSPSISSSVDSPTSSQISPITTLGSGFDYNSSKASSELSLEAPSVSASSLSDNVRPTPRGISVLRSECKAWMKKNIMKAKRARN